MSKADEYRDFLAPLQNENSILEGYDFHQTDGISRYLFKREGEIEVSFGVRQLGVSVRLVLHGGQMSKAKNHFDQLKTRIGEFPSGASWEIKPAKRRATIILFRKGDYGSQPDELRNWMLSLWKNFEAYQSLIAT